MESDFFYYKTFCEFGITSSEVRPDFITERLNSIPDRSFKKGEQSVSKHSGSIITKPYNLWAIRSSTTLLEEETISHHIDYLRKRLFSRIPILEKLKRDSRFEISCTIWVETNNAGIGFDLSGNDLFFLNTIANRVHFSLIAKNSLESK